MTTVDFNGTWKLVRNDENFEKFSQEMGINFVMRKIMGAMKPTMIIKQDGDTFNITMQMATMNRIQTFTIGEEFDFDFPWDKEVQRMLPIWEGKRLVLRPAIKPELPTVIREMDGEELVMTMEKGDVATKRYFKKVDN